jgi:hypothetical protein
MKMKNFIVYFLIICTVFVSCKEEQIYFNGETIIVDTDVKPDILQGEKIELDGLYAGNIWVYDTLICFSHHAFPDYHLHMFNIKTGKFLYPLCKRGIGPEEFPAFTWAEQYVCEDQVYLWVRKEFGKDECVLINLAKPDDLIIKQKINMRFETGFQSLSFSFVFILNDSLFIANNQGERQYYGEGTFIPQAYHFYHSHTKEKIKSYKPYNAFVSLSDKFYSRVWYQRCYSSMDRIKPDRSKLAMGMHYVDQINILDLTTGKIKGCRNKNSPDISYLQHDPDNFNLYYWHISVDDRYIYGLYAGVSASLPFEEYNVINVFDWDGNFIKKIVLDKGALTFALDPVNKYLYIDTNGENEEEIYRYDVGYLYK